MKKDLFLHIDIETQTQRRAQLLRLHAALPPHTGIQACAQGGGAWLSIHEDSPHISSRYWNRQRRTSQSACAVERERGRRGRRKKKPSLLEV